jgi:hypothetical protein
LEKTGGPFASINGCGNVITNWLGRSGSHSQYGSKVDASEDLDVARATFVAPLLECIGSGSGDDGDDGDDGATTDEPEDDDKDGATTMSSSVVTMSVAVVAAAAAVALY